MNGWVMAAAGGNAPPKEDKQQQQLNWMKWINGAERKVCEWMNGGSKRVDWWLIEQSEINKSINERHDEMNERGQAIRRLSERKQRN